jgi:integrase
MLPDQPLFYTKIKGSIAPMSPGNVSRIINKYADAIRPEHPNLPKHLHCHMFRRTRATGLYRNGVELEMISVILGHSSTETTRIYATPSIEMLGEAMNTDNSTIPDETPEWEENEDELARICGLR